MLSRLFSLQPRLLIEACRQDIFVETASREFLILNSKSRLERRDYLVTAGGPL